MRASLALGGVIVIVFATISGSLIYLMVERPARTRS